MRYELLIPKHSEQRKRIKLIAGDGALVDLKKGVLTFFRNEEPMHCVQIGEPMSGPPGILVKFPEWNYVSNTLITEEVIELAGLIEKITGYSIRLTHIYKNSVHLAFECGDGSQPYVALKEYDAIEVNVKNGNVCVCKHGALYRAHSPASESVCLGSFYSFIEDEVHGIVSLISALAGIEFSFIAYDRGVLRYHCVRKEWYRQSEENNSSRRNEGFAAQ